MKETVILEKQLGVHIPDIMLPAKDTDLYRWSVVACDQYTSQPEYWKEVEELVGAIPSTLHLIYPEVYLEEEDGTQRIANINKKMMEYIKEGILEKQGLGFILTVRKTQHVESRKGLMLAVDLEKYDYNRGSQTLIRATEGTVLERIPPRVRIRQNASLELPHILLLIDDPAKSVIEPLAEDCENLEKLYDFDLMMNGGHVKGYKICDGERIEGILKALEKLADPATFKSKYGVGDEKGVLLFAVGDGNHSLATAKAHWETVKAGLSPEQAEEHPARYALVEVVNVHDEGILFEPIHRVVFNINLSHLLEDMVEFFSGPEGCSLKTFDSKEALNAALALQHPSDNAHVLPFISGQKYGYVIVKKPVYNLAVGTLQSYLDYLVKNDACVKIDYIHGDDVVSSLGSKEGNIGFFLPTMNKHDLFKTVILDGVLPRKTFSMGEADEKRYYLECRKITNGT